jgi:hypothetical protein
MSSNNLLSAKSRMVLLAALVSGAIDVVPAGAGLERLTHVRVSELTRPACRNCVAPQTALPDASNAPTWTLGCGAVVFVLALNAFWERNDESRASIK